MSRTLTAPLITHIAGRAHTRCRMILFILRDGTKLGITDHDQNIDFTLPELGEEITYRADTGFQISDVQQTNNLDPTNYEVEGPISDVVTGAQLLGGRWRSAVTYLFELNWKAPTAAIDLTKGSITNVGKKGGRFKFEILDDRHKLAQTVGRVITNQCPRKHATCCVNIAPETDTTVAAIVDAMHIIVTATITAADFVGGKIWFTDGPLAGNDPVEIFGVSGSTLELFEPLPDLPDIGDAITLKEGCDGTIQMCANRYNNAADHRGFPSVPGSKVLQPAIPGQGNNV